MCGRARCTLGVGAVAAACGFPSNNVRAQDENRYRPSYNVAPGSFMPVARCDDAGQLVVHVMKWGLVPSFTKKDEKPDHFRMFNARSESVRQKSSFSRLYHKRRCLVAVEGFYEWKKEKGGKKQPYYLHFDDGRPMVFAGLYDCWKDSEGEILYTFTILTTDCSKHLEWLHDRMPVILETQEAMKMWISDENLSEEAFQKLTQPYGDLDLIWYPVTPAMGKPSFDGPECVKEIKLQTTRGTISELLGSRRGEHGKKGLITPSQKPVMDVSGSHNGGNAYKTIDGGQKEKVPIEMKQESEHDGGESFEFEHDKKTKHEQKIEPESTEERAVASSQELSSLELVDPKVEKQDMGSVESNSGAQHEKLRSQNEHDGTKPKRRKTADAEEAMAKEQKTLLSFYQKQKL